MSAEIYRAERVPAKLDAIVIGSGIGGLGAAALLAKRGKSVLVLERHYVAGGFTHVFSRKGYEWDVGLHYIGEVQRKTSLLSRIFDHISDGALQWDPMPAVYDRVCIEDDVYEYEAPRSRLLERLKGYFPQESRAIDEYFRLIDAVALSAKNFFGAKAMPDFLAGLATPWMQRRFHRLSDKTTFEVLSSLTANQRLIGVLSAQYGDYGLPPKQSSFAIHAMVTRHYFGGGNYPVGGSSRIAESIIPVITAAGGKVLVKAEVESVLTRGRRALGVRMADGHEILAPVVISDAGVGNTFERLIGDSEKSCQAIRSGLKLLPRSTGHLCVYAGMKVDNAQLNIVPSNYWIYPGDDHDRLLEEFSQDPDAPLPVVYLSFPSLKDPAWPAKHPGKSTFEVISFAPYDWFLQWQETDWRKRGHDYESLKESFAQRMLHQAYRWVPQLKGAIDYYEISTPLTTRHFANYERGEVYGLDHTPFRFRQKWLKPATPIQGLYLTGQDVVSDGIAGALLGGALTVSALLGKNILSEISKRDH